jgi:hypothetical protein
MAEKFDLPDISLNPRDPNYKPARGVGTGAEDLQLKLDRIFMSGQLDTLTDEELVTALYVIQNAYSSHPASAVRSLTINHLLTFRFLKKLDEKNTRLTWLVVILTIVAAIAGMIQAAVGIALLLRH